MRGPGKILIIDDEELVRISLGMVIERAGYTCILAEDAKQGLALCLKEEFDLILTDIVMPHMNGVEFIKRLSDESIQTPVITLTGGARIGQHNLSQDAIDAGAKLALKKPVTKDELIKSIKVVLAD